MTVARTIAGVPAIGAVARRRHRAALLGGVAALALAPGAAAVTLNYGPHPDILAGTDSRDIVLDARDSVWVAARGGPDVVHAGLGEDVVFGGPGSDELRGDEDGDRLFDDDHGTADWLIGGGEDDVLFSANDANGSDTLSCGAGSDVAFRDAGDRLRGCETINPRTFAGRRVTYATNAGQSIDGGARGRLIFAKAGDDTVNARGGKDTILLGDGHDSANGGPGADTIIDDDDDSDRIDGGDGDDTIVSASALGSADQISCGPGTDDLVYSDASDTVADDCETVWIDSEIRRPD
jgi:Ca2+-binding RTX toxin-like protein